MASQLVFRISKYLELRLEGTKTSIYIDHQKFRLCKLVVLNFPINQFQPIGDIESVDELLAENYNIAQNKKMSSKDEFWVHCSNLLAWADNSYNTSLLDSYLAFPLLKRLANLGDLVAQKVFKEEISRRLKSSVPQVIRFLINEGYTSFLDQSELFDATLNPKESFALSQISEQIKKSYYLTFDFDDLRDKFFNVFRNLEEISNNKYYYSSFKGSVRELELLIDKDRPSIPRVLEDFNNLDRMYLYISNTGQKLSEFNFQLDSLSSLKIFCYGSVRIPNIFKNFPNLRFLDIYGDISGLTQLEVTDFSQKKLNRINSNLKHVILIKLNPN